MSRLAAALVGALVLVALTAAPAAAHTRASSATNFDSRITDAPALDGVDWRVYPGGEYLEVTNTGTEPLVVLGYDGEPYLRIGPGGVERNRNSPAAYLNLERYADVAVPPRADASAAPDWERVSTTPRHAWHDHRIHWMAPTLPPAVATNADVRQHVLSWTVPFTYGDVRYELTGSLLWLPGPSWWPWVLAGLLLLTIPAALALRRSRTAALRAAAAAVAAVALANLAHLPDEVAALPLPTLDVVFGIGHNLLFIAAGLAGAVLTWRGSSSVLPLAVASSAVLFHQGLLQVSQLGASQLATVWPPAVIRLLVALSLAQAVWVTVVVAVAHRRFPSGEALPPRRGPLVPSAAGRSTPRARTLNV